MRTSWRIDWISWPVSQHTARDNARKAALVCLQRRLERDDAAAYLARQASLQDRWDGLQTRQA